MLSASPRRLHYMSGTKNFRAVARTIGMGVPLLALMTTSCSRDELAPDCFEIEGNVCVIPNPGGEEVSGTCDDIPEAAVGAYFEFDLNTVAQGGTGTYNNWMVDGLPPGLEVDPATGIISGSPTDTGEYPLDVTVTDALTGEVFTYPCGLIDVEERLSARDIRLEPNHCLPHTASKDEMVAALIGGDNAEITCLPINTDGGGSCPSGDGNGRPPPGITFDADTCTHTGSLTGNRRGTWVWMVAIQQSVEDEDDVTTYVPFCASNDVDTYHDISAELGGGGVSDLKPGLLEYDPDVAPVYPQGDQVWTIADPACDADPSLCNSYGFRFDVTCSPFDPPFSVSDSSTGQGLQHDLGAMGPVASESFRYRPWVASFNFSYCTSNSGADCDVMSGGFEDNAQTQYHYDVIGYPIEP